MRRPEFHFTMKFRPFTYNKYMVLGYVLELLDNQLSGIGAIDSDCPNNVYSRF